MQLQDTWLGLPQKARYREAPVHQTEALLPPQEATAQLWTFQASSQAWRRQSEKVELGVWILGSPGGQKAPHSGPFATGTAKPSGSTMQPGRRVLVLNIRTVLSILKPAQGCLPQSGISGSFARLFMSPGALPHLFQFILPLQNLPEATSFLL